MDDFKIDASSIINRIDGLNLEISQLPSVNNATTVGDTFKTYFEKAIGSVNEDQMTSQKVQDAYTKEDPSVSLSKVMIQMQRADISLSALVEVRNKLLDGYKTLMDMNV